MAYSAYITTLKNVEKDSRSDNLYTATCLNEKVLVGPDMHSGDKVLYLPADGLIARWFGDSFSLFLKNEDGTKQGGYLNDKGQIKVLKLRGLYSEGIAISFDKVVSRYPSLADFKGDTLTKIDGKAFVRKDIPTQKEVAVKKPRANRGKTMGDLVFPEFEMHADTKILSYYESAFKQGDILQMSLKMHGTSQRSMNTYAELPNGFFRKLFHRPLKTEAAYVVGTRQTVLGDNSVTFYGDDSFRYRHHEKIHPYVLPAMEVFYEVVGYAQKDKPIMSVADNTKMNDPKFIKQFGNTTTFDYGCRNGSSEMYVYRITAEHGKVEYTPEMIQKWCEKAGVHSVPFIAAFAYTTWEDLLGRIEEYFLEDIRDPIGETHVKEGVVIQNLSCPTWNAFKSKTYEFRILEGIIKADATEPDMEEAQEL